MASIAPYDRDLDRELHLAALLPLTLERNLHDLDESWWPLIRVCGAVALISFLVGVVVTLEVINW